MISGLHIQLTVRGYHRNWATVRQKHGSRGCRSLLWPPCCGWRPIVSSSVVSLCRHTAVRTSYQSLPLDGPYHPRQSCATKPERHCQEGAKTKSKHLVDYRNHLFEALLTTHSRLLTLSVGTKLQLIRLFRSKGKCTLPDSPYQSCCALSQFVCLIT